ncbi:GCR1-dependent translation factor [Lachnellula occidentalis]|uniref:GCR1-dependent translation factor n=1 Tax=Lachnellula occidentalis TaxID=215460 RepID=A0A8H8RHK5_9HELO|nr:GCR1-dependent translation factor [Lachnellula occidentalis]
MKFRRRPSPLLLLLLPSLVSALTVAAQDSSVQSTHTKNTAAKDSSKVDTEAPIVDLNTKPKFEIGTKDAPVDGKDGKPHAGPWVGSEKDSKKPDSDKPATKKEDAELVVDAKKDPKKESTKVGPDGTKIPLANDGVMDDHNRAVPKTGTTGTEGGVSEKDKARKAQEGQTGEKVEKTPDSPKTAPPLPHSEQTKVEQGKEKEKEKEKDKSKSKDGGDSDHDTTAEGLAGIEKPKDLPDKTNKLPNPIPGSADKNHLDVNTGSAKDPSKFAIEEEGNEGIIQPLHSYVLSLTMILFSEIGDKTFLIAALMAMKHDRLLVFSAAFSALLVMTVLSAVLGHAVPTLIPERFTHFLAAGLFLVFGGKMLKEGLAMNKDEGVGAEMQEVEMELEEKEHEARKQNRRRSSISPYALEMGLGRKPSTRKSRSGSRLPSPPRSPSSSPERSLSPKPSNFKSAVSGLTNLFSLLLSPAWVQTFVMTFLGEWGDRSQIATIAMAAGADYWWVTGGAVSGHAVCTGVAVIGGRAIAGRVSLRVVTLGGAIAFLVFGVIYLAEALYAA